MDRKNSGGIGTEEYEKPRNQTNIKTTDHTSLELPMSIQGGWDSKKDELEEVCQKLDIDIICMTETNIIDDDQIHMDSWVGGSRGRPIEKGVGGGIGILGREKLGIVDLVDEMDVLKQEQDWGETDRAVPTLLTITDLYLCYQLSPKY